LIICSWVCKTYRKFLIWNCADAWKLSYCEDLLICTLPVWHAIVEWEFCVAVVLDKVSISNETTYPHVAARRYEVTNTHTSPSIVATDQKNNFSRIWDVVWAGSKWKIIAVVWSDKSIVADGWINKYLHAATWIPVDGTW